MADAMDKVAEDAAKVKLTIAQLKDFSDKYQKMAKDVATSARDMAAAAEEKNIDKMTKAQEAMEGAAKNVRANCLAPVAWTRMTQSVPVKDEAAAARRAQMAQTIRADQPARFAVALIADAAKTVSGQFFGAAGENIILYSQPRPIETVTKAEGWTLDTILSEALPKMSEKFFPLARQAPDSAKVSIAFQSASRSMAMTDWVMVCSSTFRARAVTHSAKRRCPGRVKAQAKDCRSDCQIDQRSVACVMGHLLLRCRMGG